MLSQFKKIAFGDNLKVRFSVVRKVLYPTRIDLPIHLKEGSYTFLHHKRYFLALIFFLFSTLALAQDWQEIKGEHFIIYFMQDAAFAKGVLDKAEKDYERIASDLGYVRYSDFWTWGNRVKIHIYSDHGSFIKATGQPEWSEAMADYKNKQIISYSGSRDFLNSILPHEMAHLIFRDFVGFKGEVPLWLDEGVAQWGETAFRIGWVKSIMKEYLKDDKSLSLKKMMELDIRTIKDSDKIHIHYISEYKNGKPSFLILDSESLVRLYYLQAASLVGFLIERYGTDKFIEFCRQLRDGKDLNQALSFAYPASIYNINELEKAWNKYIMNE